MTEQKPIVALSGDAAKLGEALQNKLQANGTLLAEMDPENRLSLAGTGVMRLSVAGFEGKSFETAVSTLLADRHTTLDQYLAHVEQERQKSKSK